MGFGEQVRSLDSQMAGAQHIYDQLVFARQKTIFLSANLVLNMFLCGPEPVSCVGQMNFHLLFLAEKKGFWRLLSF